MNTSPSLTRLGATVFGLTLMSGLCAPSARAQERFYLSTDQVFAPGQPASVKLESRDLSSLQFRLYRIADPKAYFDAQSDLHRPREQVAAPRATTSAILRRALTRGLQVELQTLRRQLQPEGREALKQTFPGLHGAALSGPDPTLDKVVPLLEGHTLVDVWDQPLSSSEGWNYSNVPIPVSEPGVYLVEATANGQTAHAVLLMSHVAIVAKQSSTQLLVWAVDPASGAPREGAKVSVKVRGQAKGTKETDGQGLVRFDLGLASSAVIYAETGPSFTLLDPRFFPANLPTPRAYVYTERPVYRPGQTVFIKGFARNLESQSFTVPPPSEVQVQLVDPMGTVAQELTTTLSDRGSFDAKVTLPDAPNHGTWTVFATIDGERHAGEFKILAFVKPEVKLRVRLDNRAVRSGDKISGDVVGAYFYGAPYPGAEVKITVSRTRFHIPWYVDADYRWYYSEAEYQNTRRETVHETTCTLDGQGECRFEAQTLPDSEDFTYVVEAVAQDPKGKTIIAQTQAAVTRGAFYLTIEQPSVVTEPGADPSIVIKATGYDDAPVSTEVEVRVSAQHVAADGVDETVEVLKTRVKTDSRGKASLTLKPERAGYYQIFARATDDLNHVIEQESFLFVAESGQGVPLAPADLELVTDKKTYFAGDTATILILAPEPSAQILFTVEGGDLYEAQVVKAQGHAALVKVKITEKQTPNFFVTATCVSGAQVFSKQRSVIVPPREKLLSLEVAPDRPKVGPGDEVSFTVIVTDHAGKPVPDAEVAVGVVDEAIYSVSPEIAVPIESFFYHRRRNDVRSHDSLSFRFFGRSRAPGDEQAALDRANPFAFGSLKPQEDDRKVFEDTAAWFPSLVTDAEGKARATLRLPDNLSAWRLTARAVTRDTAVGSGTAKVIATKPLIVQAAFPSAVYDGDQGEGTLTVHNLTGQDGTFRVTFGVDAVEGSSAKVVVSTEDLSQLAVKAGENRRLPFTYAASGEGAVTVTARVQGAGQKDGQTKTAQVLPWSRTARATRGGQTAADAPLASYRLELPAGTRPEEAKVQVELLSSSLGAVQASLPYLMGFPYGCTEQTMSRFVPVLSAQRAMATLSLKVPELDEALPKAIEAGLSRLWSLQHTDGGWGWWEQDASDLWMTAWVLEGLAEAKALGVTLDADRTAKGVGYLELALSRQKGTPALTARALLALARHDRAKPAMLARAIEVTEGPEVLSALLLAAQAAGDSASATAAKDKLTASAQTGPEGVSWGVAEATDALLDRTECTAQALWALTKSGAEPQLLAGAERFLMSRFDGQSFGTTRQTALAVRALSELQARQPSAPASFVLSVNGVEVAKQTVEAGRFEPLSLTPEVKLSERSVEVQLSQTGGGRFFHTVVLTGPERRPTFEAQGNLGVVRRVYALDGTSGSYAKGAARSSFITGDPVLVAVTVTSPSPVEHFMLEDLRPAGLDPIQQDSGVQVQGIRLKPKGLHREHRADRSAFFMRRLPKGTTTFYYLARASYVGQFKALPAHAESMYLPARFQGESSSSQFEVTARR